MEDKIKNALKAMLALRAAKMDPTSMRLFTERLSRENHADVLSVLQKLAETERSEFETAVPDIATILKLVEVEKIARQNRLEAEKNKRLVGFQCPECKTTCTGWYAPQEDLSDKRCKGIPRDRRIDENDNGPRICGARLAVVFDEADEKRDEALTKWQEPAWTERSGAR